MKQLRLFFSLLVLLLIEWPTIGNAQQATDDDLVDTSVIAHLDSMLQQFHNRLHYGPKGDTAFLNKYNFGPTDVPRYSPQVIRDRLREVPAVMPMDYNPKVQAFIDLYTVHKRQLTSRLLGLQQVYFPMIEEIFYREGLPIEMKYLAVIESALNPKAVSRANAVGLWQFMLPTGRMYGLEVNSLVDERMDPYKSTVAAAKYLKDLYGMYNDWQLAIAAYNCGPGRVNYAIRRTGLRNFWKLWPYLPRETASYVPTFIAATYALKYATEHHLYPVRYNFSYAQDTLNIARMQVSLDDLAREAGGDPEHLARLNPELRRGVVPYQSTPYSVRVPLQVAEYYRRGGMDSLMARSRATQQTLAQRSTINYVVRKGDSPESIAERFDVPEDSLRAWNRLRTEFVHPGQKLRLLVRPEIASTYAPPKAPATAKRGGAKPAPNGQVHRVQEGDSLWTIATRYRTTVDELVSLNNLSRNSVLRIGQEIRLKN